MIPAQPDAWPRHSLRIYRVALVAAAIFQILHLFLLPTVISPDGLEYISLSRLFGSSQAVEHWSFFRMPLYPLLLRATFASFGENATAAVVPGAILGFAGIWVLASELRRSASPIIGALVIVLLSLYPVLVAYQHTVLTEPGTFCVLAVVVALLLRMIRQGVSVATSSALAAALAIGYLYRATLLAVVPAAAVFVGTMAWRDERLAWRGVACALIVVCLPLIAWRAWNADGRQQQVSRAFGVDLLLNLAQHGILRDDDPLLAPVRLSYQAASSGRGMLSLRPVPDDVAEVLASHAESGSAIFVRAIRSNPGAALMAAVRTGAAFAGIRTATGENHLFTSNVLSLSVPDSKCVCPSDRRAAFDRAFAQPGRRSPMHYLLKALYPLYLPLVVVGWLFTLAALVVGFRRHDARLLAVSVVPVTFAAVHVALAFGIDRYAAPTFPLALANLCAVGHWIARPTSAPGRAMDARQIATADRPLAS
ncbi:unnamed protein product [uncultured bacterium]|nr:unnamed protein product [uncultured bacterium]